jgi:Arc/MetJ-type ribon-helix-helix transcriptional regulator
MISFPPDIEAYVQEKIAPGQFHSREEIAVEALRVYRDMEKRHAELKADIQAALAEVRNGGSEPLDIAAIQAELLEELDDHGRPKAR